MFNDISRPTFPSEHLPDIAKAAIERMSLTLSLGIL